jgi:hypothetical protein
MARVPEGATRTVILTLTVPQDGWHVTDGAHFRLHDRLFAEFINVLDHGSLRPYSEVEQLAQMQHEVLIARLHASQIK